MARRVAGGLRDHLCGLQLMRSLWLWLVVVLVGLGVAVPERAEAAQVRCNASAKCTIPEAQAECQSFDPLPTNPNIVRVTTRECMRTGSGTVASGTYTLRYKGINSAGTELGWYLSETFYFLNNCPSAPSYTGQGPWSNLGGSARSGSIGCRNGCDGMWGKNVDSSFTWTPTGAMCPDDERKNCEQPAMANAGYYWNVALSVCEPPKPQCEGGKNPNSLGQCAPEPCPDGMASQADGTCKKKDNECPAGQVRSPDGKCLPGDGQCASGEVRGPDGTCKKDSDGDGKPDPVDEESFSGGDDCSSPPACSGSPIMCGQARIQWRIDCNTRKNRNIAGGTCNSMPICTGEKCDAMEYAGLLMQWRTACAVEKLANAAGNGGENGDVKAIRDALTGTGGSVTTPGDRPASDVWSPSSGQPTRPDSSGYGWGRGCPQPPAIEVMGQTIAFDITPLCRWLGLGSYFVVGLAALFCLRIIASRDA
ncbi:hypothetical protein JY419_02750 [Stenotrophomonas maltophilia]|nr:hypothetical protein [Stenotrophomonas maltophilia]